MATGACGINCDVCRLNLLGLCTTCGGGKSLEAEVKLAAQERVLGDTCAILSCAALNNIGHCMRDCSQFPCENFTISPAYPFSSGFLDMQKRRRREWLPRIDPLGKSVEIPDEYWEAMGNRDLNLVQSVTLAHADENSRLSFGFLDLGLRLDIQGRQLEQMDWEGRYAALDLPLLTLTVLIYFKTVDRLFPMGRDLISIHDMDNQGSYFAGNHELKTGHVLNRFKDDIKGLGRSAAALGGKPAEMGDHAWEFRPFPRLAVYYVFWDLETEYDPRLSILFDRSICRIFNPPMVWELVNLVNARLLSV
ncbi:MAG: DUF3786 domain-containing protein [Desulfobacter sp.]|nr:MAG: DUF3786 domain-containing protein [Desulfobacter sp.]